jgi:oligopeptide transport system permease protein
MSETKLAKTEPTDRSTDAGAEFATAEPVADEARSLWSDAWRSLRRNPVFLISSVAVAVIITIAVAPGLFTDVSPRRADLANHYLQGPHYTHFFQGDWLGYNGQGQSIYSRILYGARISVIVSVGATILVTLLGSLVGMLAGYFGGWIDAVLSRITDIFLGVPFLLGALVMLSMMEKRSVWAVTGVIAALAWTQIARVMRGSVLTVKQADYVVAARALGAGTGRILMRHILPNAVAPVIVVATLALGGFIVTEAYLSFLGLGVPAPAISWGGDISVASNDIRVAPHTLFVPSVMLSVTVLSFIMLGEAVRDALDPKLR